MQEIENFGEFNFAQTVEEKKVILEKLISDNQISEQDIKELQSQINDIIENEANEENVKISLEIEDGKFTLYSCIKSIDSYKFGCNYYVKVDNPKDFYKMTGIGETNSIIQNMIDSIKPIYYLVFDGGIGTLNRNNILSKNVDFSDYFIKFVNIFFT
jgi:hypothetical protein